MQCVSISGLKFDSKSIAAIEDIKRRSNLTTILSRLLPFGVMTNIFLGNGAIVSTYNISQTDFKLLADSVASLSIVYRRVIVHIAWEQQMDHFGSERQFWEGVANGCTIK